MHDTVQRIERKFRTRINSSSFQSCWKSETLSESLTAVIFTYPTCGSVTGGRCDASFQKHIGSPRALLSVQLVPHFAPRGHRVTVWPASNKKKQKKKSRPLFLCGVANYLKHERFLFKTRPATGVHFTYRWQWSIDALCCSLSELPPPLLPLLLPPPAAAAAQCSPFKRLKHSTKLTATCPLSPLMLKPPQLQQKSLFVQAEDEKAISLSPWSPDGIQFSGNHKRVSFTWCWRPNQERKVTLVGRMSQNKHSRAHGKWLVLSLSEKHSYS